MISQRLCQQLPKRTTSGRIDCILDLQTYDEEVNLRDSQKLPSTPWGHRIFVQNVNLNRAWESYFRTGDALGRAVFQVWPASPDMGREFTRRLPDWRLPSRRNQSGSSCPDGFIDGHDEASSRAHRGPQIADQHRGELNFIFLFAKLMNVKPLDCGTMRVIISHNVANAVPFGVGKTFQDLASDVNLDVGMLTRVLRYCMTNGVFREDPIGRVKHTAASAALKRTGLGEALKWSVEIPAFSALHISDALRTFGTCNSPKASPFNLAYSPPQTMWEYQGNRPEMQRLFSINMTNDGEDTRLAPEHILLSFDWEKLGNATVVDVRAIITAHGKDANR